MASQFNFTCPHCAQPYSVPEEQKSQYLGKTISCQRCQKPFVVTDTASPVAPNLTTNEAVGHATPDNTNLSISGFAITSLVLGIVSLCASFIAGIPAIIFAILAMKKVRRGEATGQGLAVAGLTLGIVGCVFTCLTISILLPSLNKAREMANRVKCAANMSQIGQGVLLYANENQGKYPDSLATLMTTQSIGAQVLLCPSSNGPVSGNSDYTYVGQNLTSQSGPNSIVLYETLTDHANDGINVLFGDGHVEFVSAPSAKKMIADVEAGINPPR